MSARAIIAIVLVACSSSDQAPVDKAPVDKAPVDKRDVPRVESPSVDKPPVDRPAAPKRATVRWSAVQRTDGCFFFSGPDGRDDQVGGEVVVETVEREGATIKLRIGTATFDGTYENGGLALTRESTYEFGGPWRTTETIRGTLVDGVIVATYGYQECELAAPQCPGRCTVTGTLTFARGL